ncbi:MAG: DUF5797 family protein [Halobacteriaceae archaeon]
MLSEEARERLADVVELQPTKNAELQRRWGMESGGEVHRYLEEELGEYYYRDEDSRIRATGEAVELVGGEAPESVGVSEFEAAVVDALPDHDERSASVVATLHALDAEADAGEVRRALGRLRRKGVVEVIERTVSTYRLAVPRSELSLAVTE